MRYNQQADIDASPFFYGDVENMLELIDGAERLHYKTGIDGHSNYLHTD